MSLISSGSSRAIRSVGRSRISSSDARSISLTSHAFASSSRERSRRASGPRMGVMRRRSVFAHRASVAALDDPTPARGVRRTEIERRAPGKIPAVAELISIDEARRRVLEAARPLAAEDVPLDEALNRVLAEDLTSAIAVPPFDGSAMDGYALASGPATELELVGESRA